MAKKKPAAMKAEPFGESPDLALADPPKRGRGRPPKQPMLSNDPAFERISDIENAVDMYIAAQDARLKALAEEVAMKKKLVELMKANEQEVYQANGCIVVLSHIDEDEIKIKKRRAVQENGNAA